MSLQSTTQVYIDSNELPDIKSINLFQSIDSHHLLELIVRMDVLEKLTDELIFATKNFLGKRVSVRIFSLDDLNGYETLEFMGIVTARNSVKGFYHGMGDEIVITGQSPTYLSEDGPHYMAQKMVHL